MSLADTAPDSTEPLAVPLWHPSKPSACSMLGISRTLGYQLAADGRIPTIRLGQKRIVVSVEALKAMLSEHED